MKLLLIDGTNMSRRGDYDPRFPEMEERRALEVHDRACRLAESRGGRLSIELVFDGPPRAFGDDAPGLRTRFSGDRSADELILGTVRLARAQGHGVTVATEDGSLRREVQEEGGSVIGFAELRRL